MELAIRSLLLTLNLTRIRVTASGSDWENLRIPMILKFQSPAKNVRRNPDKISNTGRPAEENDGDTLFNH